MVWHAARNWTICPPGAPTPGSCGHGASFAHSGWTGQRVAGAAEPTNLSHALRVQRRSGENGRTRWPTHPPNAQPTNRQHSSTNPATNPDTLNPARFRSWSPCAQTGGGSGGNESRHPESCSFQELVAMSPTGGGSGRPWSSGANRVGWGCRKATRRRGQSLRGRGGQRGISRWSAHGPHQEGLLHGRLCTSQTAGR